jgi:hypothetical protein
MLTFPPKLPESPKKPARNLSESQLAEIEKILESATPDPK